MRGAGLGGALHGRADGAEVRRLLPRRLRVPGFRAGAHLLDLRAPPGSTHGLTAWTAIEDAPNLAAEEKPCVTH